MKLEAVEPGSTVYVPGRGGPYTVGKPSKQFTIDLIDASGKTLVAPGFFDVELISPPPITQKMTHNNLLTMIGKVRQMMGNDVDPIVMKAELDNFLFGLLESGEISEAKLAELLDLSLLDVNYLAQLRKKMS